MKYIKILIMTMLLTVPFLFTACEDGIDVTKDTSAPRVTLIKDPGDNDTLKPIVFKYPTASSVTVTWGMAEDNRTRSQSIEYMVVLSTAAESIDTPEEAQNVSPLDVCLNWSKMNFSSNVAGLIRGTTYYFTVMARDESGNIALMGPTAFTPTTDADTIPPVVGQITGNYSTYNSLTITWSPASDDTVLDPNDLEYKVVISTKQAIQVSGITVFNINNTTNVANESYTTSPVDSTTDGHWYASAGTDGWEKMTIDLATGKLSKEITGLFSGKTYYVNIAVRDNNKNKAIYSSKYYKTSDAPDTTPPTTDGLAIAVSDIATTTMKVSWPAASDVGGNSQLLNYKLYMATEGHQTEINEASEANQIEVTGQREIISDWSLTRASSVTKLKPSTKYYFSVFVKDSSGNIAVYPVTDPMTGYTTLADTTGPVTTGLAITFTAPKTFSWVEASDDATAVDDINYRLHKSSTPFSVTNVPSDSTAVTSWSILENAENTPATTTYYTVEAKDTVGNKSVYDQIVIDKVAPTVGTGLTYSNITGGSATVNWGRATDDVDLYNSTTGVDPLFYKVVTAASSGAIDTIAEAEAATISLDYTTNITNANISGLNSESNYYFAVIVKDNAGNKSLYAPVQVTTIKNIYMAGSYNKSTGGKKACYWKNLTKYDLTVPADSYSIEAKSIISLSDNTLYICGTNTNSSGVMAPIFWKVDSLGTVTIKELDPVVAGKHSSCESMVASGTSIYIVGSAVNAGDIGVSLLYISVDNGDTWTKIDSFLTIDATHTQWSVKSVAVSGTVIYLAGYYINGSAKGVPFYATSTDLTALTWNAAVDLPVIDATMSSYAQSIIVNAADVYVIGQCPNSSGVSIPVLWKNGSKNELNSSLSFAYSVIFGSDSKVYITGQEAVTESTGTINEACYWSFDGSVSTKYSLAGVVPAKTSSANSIVMRNGKKYISGFSGYSATTGIIKGVIWQEGVLNSNIPGGTTNETVNSIYIAE